jgi:hypothetical protein
VDQAAGASRVNVTQWMSTVTVSEGSASNSSHRFPALIARSSPAVEAGALGPNSRDHDRAGTGGASCVHGAADAASTRRPRRGADGDDLAGGDRDEEVGRLAVALHDRAMLRRLALR